MVRWAHVMGTARGDVTADAMFVGYGISSPENKYDDYAGVDVKGKIVVMSLAWRSGKRRFPFCFLPHAW